MAQEFGMIGTASAEVERVAGRRQGWGRTPDPGPVSAGPEEPIAELTDASDISFWDRRANHHEIGPEELFPNWVGHEQTPATAQQVRPPGS